MDTELLTLVCGQRIDTLVIEPAVVADHVPLWVVDDDYPVLVPRPGNQTHGLIIRGLSSDALNRILFFEGGEFDMLHIEVVNAEGFTESVPYFAGNEKLHASDNIWRLEQWQRSNKAMTMLRVARYMQCYGKMSSDEADAYW